MDFDLCRELQKEAEKASFEVYSGEKLSPGKFGVMEYGTPKQRMYGVVSNLLYDRENDRGWFYPFTGGTIGFDAETGMRHENCRVVEIESIPIEEAKERYRTFIRSKKEKQARRIDKEKEMRIYLCRMGRLLGGPCLHETKREVIIGADEWNGVCENPLFEELLVEGELQVLAEDADGNELLSAFLKISQARGYLERLFGGLECWGKILAIFPLKGNGRQYIGIDFFKLNE